MSTEYQTLLIRQPEDHVVVVTLNRPETSNAINTQMGRELMTWFEETTLNPGDARCIVLTGAGEKAFCAGGDLKERKGMTDDAWTQQHAMFERMLRAVMACPVPILGAVNGVAYGGGTEVAAACDFLYASEHARFALTEVTLGIMPGCGGTQNLPRAVGERRAKELILAARAFTAEEGYEWGLVNRLCEPGKALADALETARAIAENAPLSARQAKKSIHYGLQTDIATGYRFEIEAYNRLVTTEDRIEGVRAFNEKRKPAFRGR